MTPPGPLTRVLATTGTTNPDISHHWDHYSGVYYSPDRYSGDDCGQTPLQWDDCGQTPLQWESLPNSGPCTHPDVCHMVPLGSVPCPTPPITRAPTHHPLPRVHHPVYTTAVPEVLSSARHLKNQENSDKRVLDKTRVSV